MKSQDSDEEGFRSRDNDIKKRIEERNKIFKEFESKRPFPREEPKLSKYIGVS